MGLQYVVCSPAAVVTLVKTGVFNFTLVQTSATLGNAGSFGFCGGAGAPGGFGIEGALGSLAPGTGGAAGIFAPGNVGVPGAFIPGTDGAPGTFIAGIVLPGIWGLGGGGTWGKV